MSETVGTAGFLDTFRARGAAIADACTRCGDCFRACPMVEPAGLAAADPEEVTGAIVDLITGGTGNADAIRWAGVCSGSGNCIPACQHGINPASWCSWRAALPAAMPARRPCRPAGASRFRR